MGQTNGIITYYGRDRFAIQTVGVVSAKQWQSCHFLIFTEKREVEKGHDNSNQEKLVANNEIKLYAAAGRRPQSNCSICQRPLVLAPLFVCTMCVRVCVCVCLFLFQCFALFYWIFLYSSQTRAAGVIDKETEGPPNPFQDGDRDDVFAL